MSYYRRRDRRNCQSGGRDCRRGRDDGYRRGWDDYYKDGHYGRHWHDWDYDRRIWRQDDDSNGNSNNRD
ncbi:hypothetical protein AALB39_08520 [Lachnospiraceae bacterium 54-53]